MLPRITHGIQSPACDLLHDTRDVPVLYTRHGNDAPAHPRCTLEDLLLDPAGLPDPVLPLLGNPHGPHQLRHGIKDTVETVPAVDVLRVLSTLLSAEISFLNVSTPDRVAEALLQKCCLPPSRSAVAKMLHV